MEAIAIRTTISSNSVGASYEWLHPTPPRSQGSMMTPREASIVVIIHALGRLNTARCVTTCGLIATSGGLGWGGLARGLWTAVTRRTRGD